jgi:hypothetical protein
LEDYFEIIFPSPLNEELPTLFMELQDSGFEGTSFGNFHVRTAYIAYIYYWNQVEPQIDVRLNFYTSLRKSLL